MKCIFGILVMFPFIVGCSSGEDGNWAGYETVSSLSLRLLGLTDGVEQVDIYDETTESVVLSANFDQQGRCTYWNTTGVMDNAAAAVSSRAVGSGWMTSPAFYHYSYTPSGKLSTVTCHALEGEEEQYVLSYGSHSCSFPLPFPFGPYELGWVKGVTSITSSHYTFSYDGEQAFSERRILSWMNMVERSEYVVEQDRVTEQTSRLFTTSPDGEERQIQRVRTFYDYEGSSLQRLLTVIVDEDGHQEKMESVFATGSAPYLLHRNFYVGNDTIPVSAVQYQYDSFGRIIAVTDISEISAFEEPYTQCYLSVDERGNWTVSQKDFSSGECHRLVQRLHYW